MTALNISPLTKEQKQHPDTLRLAMRLFRPVLQARVVLAEFTPRYVAANGIRGNVI